MRTRRAINVFYQVLGDILITIAVIIGLYIFWQVYYTTWSLNDSKQQAVVSFQEKYAPSDGVNRHKIFEPPPGVPPVKYGETFATLHVPSWDNAVMPIAEGVGLDVLDKAFAGHYTVTNSVGEVGNFGLAAHRLTYGNNFDRLPQLRDGDEVIVETDRAYVVYKIYEHKIVLPTQSEVLLPVPGNLHGESKDRLITMTTCTGIDGSRWGSSHRWITHGKFAYWYDKKEGKPEKVK